MIINLVEVKKIYLIINVSIRLLNDLNDLIIDSCMDGFMKMEICLCLSLRRIAIRFVLMKVSADEAIICCSNWRGFIRVGCLMKEFGRNWLIVIFRCIRFFIQFFILILFVVHSHELSFILISIQSFILTLSPIQFFIQSFKQSSQLTL